MTLFQLCSRAMMVSWPWPYLTLFVPPRPVYAISESSEPIPSPSCQSRIPPSLTQSSLHLINALQTLWSHSEPAHISSMHPEPSGLISSQSASKQHTPLHLVNAFPTPTPIPNLIHLCPSLLLCQVHSQWSISLVTAVGQSPITYLPCSMHHSLLFLTTYIFVSPPVCCMFLMSHHSLPSVHFSVSFSVLCLHSPFILSIFILSSLSTLLHYSVLSLWFAPDHLDHPDPYHTPYLYKYSSYKCCSL